MDRADTTASARKAGTSSPFESSTSRSKVDASKVSNDSKTGPEADAKTSRKRVSSTFDWPFESCAKERVRYDLACGARILTDQSRKS